MTNALLLDIRENSWMLEDELRKELLPHMPGVQIYCGIGDEPLPDVTMLAAVALYPGVAKKLPNLKLIQKLGAGVDKIVRDPDLRPDVRVTRLKPDAPAREIAEYCLAYVMREQRHMLFHAENAAHGRWEQKAPRQTPFTTIGVLGLGHIGGRTAKMFADLGFRVLGWSRSPKAIDGIECRAGLDALAGLLAECDYVCCILPSTPDTQDLFDAGLLAQMKPGAVLINAGRGDLIVEADLLAALDVGPLAAAVLDVVPNEPLPEDHPFWRHDKVTITPHISGWHLDRGIVDIVENYNRMVEGKPLLHEVDRTAGY